MNKIDLHTHTTCSDGTLSPRELVRLAKSSGFKAIAITDHDTVEGNAEARETGTGEGLEVIEGVELSVEFSPGTMHILGYFVNSVSPELTKSLDFVQRARRERNPKIVEKLRKLGLDISYEEVLKEAGGGQVGRPHFAGVLVKKGYVRDKGEAFARYLAKGRAAYVDKGRFAPREAAEIIHNSGGLVVLAHPSQLHIPTKENLRKLIDELVGYGLDGIEVYSSCHTRKEARLYAELAEEYKLFVAAGSDFHGDNSPGIKLGNVGPGVKVDYELVSLMKEAMK
ncbi:MAG: PHP domain-containing protein [Candidatus Omnitrophica bacterium]|nr:PHP domain-containing protein [Candidatus Omnitrophota bacterium]